jgi:hypothetical protein
MLKFGATIDHKTAIKIAIILKKLIFRYKSGRVNTRASNSNIKNFDILIFRYSDISKSVIC